MPPIELEDMKSILLMNRVDTKYLTDVDTVRELLPLLSACGYSAFSFMGSRIHGYRSMYYDTPGLQMYLDHHNRRLVRQKLRTRCYLSSGITFLELKSKNNHGRTEKKRIEIPPEQYLSEIQQDTSLRGWLDGRLVYCYDSLSPSLETDFSRITLVNADKTERTTIDFDLRFTNTRNGIAADFGSLAIIEVKQDGNIPSQIRDLLLELRVKPFRISKYCMGLAMTDPTLRKGRFKSKLMIINKMKEKYA